MCASLSAMGARSDAALASKVAVLAPQTALSRGARSKRKGRFAHAGRCISAVELQFAPGRPPSAQSALTDKVWQSVFRAPRSLFRVHVCVYMYNARPLPALRAAGGVRQVGWHT